MKFTANQIAEMLNGVVDGDPNIMLNQLAKIEEGSMHSLSFLSNPKYNEYLYETKSSAVIVNKSFVPDKKVEATLIKVDDAYASFAQLLRIVEDLQKKKSGIEDFPPTSINTFLAENDFLFPLLSIDTSFLEINFAHPSIRSQPEL